MDLEVKPYTEQPFRFSGKALEFFGIWIVNIALTIVTLGIYSAWAKVRTHRYFYGNTQLDDSAFQYLAKPEQILKGRIFASILFGIYYAINSYNGLWGLYAAAAVTVLVPAIIVLSMSFRLRHTAYRGITFRFERNFKQAYLFYGLPVFLFLALLVSSIYFSVPSEVWEYSEVPISEEMPADETTEIPAAGEEANIDIEEEFNMPWGLAALFPLFILGFPFWQYLKAIFLVNNARYGTSPFSYGAGAKSFYLMYLKASGVFILAISIVLWTLSQLDLMNFTSEETAPSFSNLILIQLVFFTVYLWIFAYLQTKRQNLIFNHTQIEEMTFSSTLSVSYMLYLYLSNTIAIICSLGLLIPWSMIRTARYRASQLTLLTNQSLDNFVADQQNQLTAMGEEFGEVFDIEVGI